VQSLLDLGEPPDRVAVLVGLSAAEVRKCEPASRANTSAVATPDPLLRVVVSRVVALVGAFTAVAVVGGDPVAVATATGVGIAAAWTRRTLQVLLLRGGHDRSRSAAS